MPETTRAEIADTGLVEAVLFAAGNPVPVKELAAILELDVLGTQNILTRLQQELDERHSGLTLRQVAGGYQLATRPEAFATVERLSQVVDRKISAPTMETLSIIAFKQPITKAEIEQIRGVRIERALQKLIELELIAEVGRKQVLGRPILYGTTDTFLRCFGINTLDELPELPTTEEAVAALDNEQMLLFQEVQQLQAGEETAAAEEETDE
ncbi:MAG: SMC-Scp complex subunit ScpB [Selenomonas sp.]|uniref:SMC-Scp complex subunit ScpB n=1 Tax=Selenomonas sp. AE3005 TaxID=1485543 RepID=UPI000485903E|nr:SMC-Scp complex subunit ScpB [Selenomonas sp. AE3005]MBQ1614811.1 SMC-Scp complex subunit ScpB [Selenomonas sp.]MBQ1919939.1 SMC-Scp complex subunit ScpB [Selenomonas sp.]MBQ2088306.1 SMC-Scp complex subunit ScpB [Selenomonas sp.]MBQ4212209.1 SMC-Scp complex subunit ScpB [Selenomonas sp.]MBQ5501971.1 SMC-Scp complex subunit ScpB [Selenomonas sp.]